MKKIVVACFGNQQSLDRIAQLSRDADVIAVAMDLSGCMPLSAIRDSALAAGALRCHALDVREEFARECLIPVLHTRAGAHTSTAVNSRIAAFIALKIAEIAGLEAADEDPGPPEVLWTRPLPAPSARPVQLDVRFEDGVPVAVNGVEMTLSELVDSLETITGEPALQVLEREFTRLHEQSIA
jgi:argininosuccinate synthase